MIQKKIESYVFDNQTHLSLLKLSSNKIIDSVVMPIASGKEAITFLGYFKDTALAVKIYKIETTSFKNMQEYIKGDYRFKKQNKDKREMFYEWASKEYKNLTKSLDNNVSCPVVISKLKNILIMSFLGENGIPFPQLNKAEFDFDNVYPQIIENYSKMLYGARLVHADFSAYNILINPKTQKIFIIDMGQAVIDKHPKAKEFLKRDIVNITNFLNKKFRKDLTYENVLEDIKKNKGLYARTN